VISVYFCKNKTMTTFFSSIECDKNMLFGLIQESLIS
jgi:hypothetical protein